MTVSAPRLRPALYALFPFLAYLLAWYYNGQLIPLLAGSMILLMLWGAWVWWPRLREGLPWPRGFLPVFMLAWLIWFGATLFWSGVPYTSWFYFWVLGSLPLAFLVWIALPADVAEGAWRCLWLGAVVSAVALSLYALWQYDHWMGRGVGLTGLRPLGPLLDTNSFAAWLNLLFFPLLAAYFSSDAQRRERFLSTRVHWVSLGYLITMTLLLLAFFSTNSRGGFLAWLCTMPIALWGLRRQPGARGRSFLVLGLAAIAFLLFGYVQGYDLLGHLAPGFITHNISTVSRGLMWLATWHIFLSHPWLGTGLGSYFLYYPAYRLPGELASAGTYAHNDYIEYLAEGGLINLGFLLTFAGVLIFALYRLLVQGGKALGLADDKRLQALGLVLGVFAITGHALGNFIFYNLPLSLLGGLFLARAWQIFGARGWTAPLLPRMGINHPFIVQTVLAIALVAGSWNLVCDGLSFSLLSDNAWLNRWMPNAGQRAVFLLRAADWLALARPLATQPHVYLANTYLSLATNDRVLDEKKRRELLRSALHEYQESLVGIPRQGGVWNSIGTLYLSEGKLLGLSTDAARRAALLAWRKGLAVDPESVALRTQIAELAYLLPGHIQEGLAFLRAGLHRPLFPDSRSALQMNIAMTQWRAHDAAGARQTLVRLLQENPAYTPAVGLLQSMLHPLPAQPKEP